MATPKQIEEQVNLERKAIAMGLERLHKNTKKLEDKTYASATVYGVSSIDTLLPLVVDEIKETNNRIYEGHTGKAFKEIAIYLTDLEPLAAAAIGCKVTFDQVFSTKDDANQAANVCSAIGQAVEDECHMRHYEAVAPGLLQVLKKNYWHDSCGTKQRLTVIKTLMKRSDVQEWKPWGRVNRVKLGGWLLNCIMQVSGWFTKEAVRRGKKTISKIVPTEEFLAVKDAVMAQCELFAPIALPMLIEPNDWSGTRCGGYLLNEVMRGHTMVRRGEQSRLQEDTPYVFLNRIQKVGLAVNHFILEVAKELASKRISVGKFITDYNVPEPVKPVDIETNDSARQSYRRAMAEWYNDMQLHLKRQVRTNRQLETAEMFKDKEFFLPWSFDYRGRAYPIPAFLTPQDTDFGKSLLVFSNPAFVDDDAEGWLSYQVATTYGLDKASMAERLQWTAENHDVITRVATDPIGNRCEWEGADEPWQFLAACDEYYRCCIECSSQSTRLPVASDATCSGLQILAGLAQDASTARLVNVLPSDRPQDAYKVVAEAAKPHCPEHLRHMMNRKIVKRVVMTIPYNAKPRSNRRYIKEAFFEEYNPDGSPKVIPDDKVGFEVDQEDLTIVVQAVRDAMHHIVPGPMAVMAWIEKQVSRYLKSGATEIKWLTPSGFLVNQKLMKPHVERVQLRLMGQVTNYRVADGDTDEVDISHHKSATSPNLIHSLDASLLHLAVTTFDAPIMLIHDSVLCRATDMGILSDVVRDTYLRLFGEREFLKEFAEAINADEAPPIIGDLDPERVMESTYFFC